MTGIVARSKLVGGGALALFVAMACSDAPEHESGAAGRGGTAGSGVAGKGGGSGRGGTSGAGGASGKAGNASGAPGAGEAGENGTGADAGEAGHDAGSAGEGAAGAGAAGGVSGSAGTSGAGGVSGSAGTGGTGGVSGFAGTSGAGGASGSAGTSGAGGLSGSAGTVAGTGAEGGTAGASANGGVAGVGGSQAGGGQGGAAAGAGTGGSAGETCTEISAIDPWSETNVGTPGQAYLRFEIDPELGDALDDTLTIEFRHGGIHNGGLRGPFALDSGPDASYATCSRCVSLSDGARTFFVSEGTLTLEYDSYQMKGYPHGLLEGVVLREATIDISTGTTFVGGGACLRLATTAFNVAPPAPGWYDCRADYYDDGFFCDCGCGAFDPDCANSTLAACQYCWCPGDPIGGSCSPTDVDPVDNGDCL